MSKYDFDFADKNDTRMQLLEAIANELAESNRLRRVAIDLELIKQIDPAQLVDFKFKADEDLA